MNNPTRRQFLKLTAAGAVGAILPFAKHVKTTGKLTSLEDAKKVGEHFLWRNAQTGKVRRKITFDGCDDYIEVDADELCSLDDGPDFTAGWRRCPVASFVAITHCPSGCVCYVSAGSVND